MLCYVMLLACIGSEGPTSCRAGAGSTMRVYAVALIADCRGGDSLFDMGQHVFLAPDSIAHMLSAPYAIARPSVCHTGGSVENGRIISTVR